MLGDARHGVQLERKRFLAGNSATGRYGGHEMYNGVHALDVVVTRACAAYLAASATIDDA